jgi:manganese-dependent ADP-ribose/CDP-alcohol diphosphatase
MRALGLLALALAAAPGFAQEFSFAAVADIQYADKDTAGRREFRRSAAKLEACAAALAAEHPAFTVQLGDIIDGGLENLDRILPLFHRLPAPRYHTLGNHDLTLERAVLFERLGLRSGHYDFAVNGWRFLVLDGMQISVRDEAGRREFARLKAAGAPNAQEWNGGLGADQREWIRRTLRDARKKHERAILFCHFPVLAGASSPEHLLWDWRETLAILDSEPAAAAWIAGHDHRGGYAERRGVHYVTLRGMVETEAAQACQVMEVTPAGLRLRPAGASGQGPAPVWGLRPGAEP